MAKDKANAGKRDPSDLERSAIEAARASFNARPIRAEMVMEVAENGSLNAEAVHNDEIGAAVMVNDAFGSSSHHFVNQCVTHLANATTATGGDVSPQGLNAALALVGAIDPRDELEAALATQMVATHEMMLMMSNRARSAQRLESIKEYGNLATKMARTFTTQIKALGDMRRGGEQVVRHIHVHEGGQAVVAETFNVHGGHNANPVGQSHAFSAALLGQDTAGRGVPISSGARPEAVPHARRDQSGRSEGE